MSWYSSLFPRSCYYTKIASEDYYEWLHQGYVPSGTVVSYGNPKNNKVASTEIIVALPQLNDTSIKDGVPIISKDYKNTGGLLIISGNIKSQKELIEEYKRKDSELKNNLKAFSEVISARGYWIKKTEKNDFLFMVESVNEKEATMLSYGSLEDVVNKLKKAKIDMKKDVQPPGYKARDFSDIVKIEKLMYTIYNDQLDGNKLKTLLTKAQIKPLGKTKTTVIDCFLQISDNANLVGQIKKFSNLKWARRYFEGGV